MMLYRKEPSLNVRGFFLMGHASYFDFFRINTFYEQHYCLLPYNTRIFRRVISSFSFLQSKLNKIVLLQNYNQYCSLMTCTLIIATYNWHQALELVLISASKQTVLLDDYRMQMMALLKRLMM